MASLSGELDIPSAGRPFQLGMLYDCCSDNIADEVLEIKGGAQPRCITKFVQLPFKKLPNEKTSTKLKILGIKGELALSVVTGLTESNELIEFINTVPLSSRQVRVILHCKCTTRTEQVTCESFQRSGVHGHHVNRKATHVVTRVQYGFEGFFVFEHDVAPDEKADELQKKLEEVVRCVSAFDKKSDQSLQNHSSAFLENIRCTYQGDCQLPVTVSTLDDARKLFQMFPTLFDSEKKAHDMPVSVSLCPLNKIDKTHSVVVKKISESIIRRFESILEYFDTAIIQSIETELNLDPIFSLFHAQLSQFSEIAASCRTSFMHNVSSHLASIRKSQKDEADIALVLKSQEEHVKCLITWMEAKKQESVRLRSYILTLRNMPG